uniref:Truncated diaphanous-related formin 1 n=2 Tax=Lymnaea stagnalis TaxID=6523 RepID=A0A1D8KD17_LYMST|nr:truncated diaphanous-related formin 1 [Lymnaea stagnalis]
MFFNKKGRKPSKSTSSTLLKSLPLDDHGFNGGDPFTETVDFQHMGDNEVDQQFEQLLDDMNSLKKRRLHSDQRINLSEGRCYRCM